MSYGKLNYSSKGKMNKIKEGVQNCNVHYHLYTTGRRLQMNLFLCMGVIQLNSSGELEVRSKLDKTFRK